MPFLRKERKVNVVGLEIGTESGGQIIPSILKDLMKDPATNSSASSCMMSMGKFDIAALQKAVSNS